MNQCGRKPFLTSNSGVALIMVIWLIALLMTTALSVSMLVKSSLFAVRATSDSIRRKSVAQSGIERAIVELSYRRTNIGEETLTAEHRPWKQDGRPYTFRIGDSLCVVRIIQESGKIQINTLTDSTGIILRNLLGNLGVSLETAQTIVDSILDWKDQDELHRLNGAESDYYSSLPAPYKAKNAPFDTLEELLLVKGMSREILFGSSEHPGLINFLTIFTRDNKININSAARETLLSIPGATSQSIETIMAYREEKDFKSLKEVESLLGTAYDQISPYLTADETNLFSIYSAALTHNGRESFRIRGVIVFEGTTSWYYLYYKAPA